MEDRDEENVINESSHKSEITFDNFVILKEFSNIVNHVSNEDFLETVPKAKMKRVKWVPLFNCLKQGILDEMIQEMNSMWAAENLHQKLEILQKQQGKYSHIDPSTSLWRPKLGDVKSQLKAHDVANLQKQKTVLESLAKEYEARVSRLKKILSAKRGYVKALQMDVYKYQKKNENIVSKISEKLENHEQLSNIIAPTKPDIEIDWTINDTTEFDDHEQLANIIAPTKPDIETDCAINDTVEFDNDEQLANIIAPTKLDIEIDWAINVSGTVECDEKIENA